MDHSLPKVAIIILNWNGWRDTIECLASSRQLTYPNYQVVVVDNGSTDGSREKIERWARENLGEGRVCVSYPADAAAKGGEEAQENLLEQKPSAERLVLISNHENLGFCGGNNAGIGYAVARKYPADYIFIINNDVVMERECITKLVEAARKTNAALVGALFKDEQGRIIPPPIVKNLTAMFFSSLVRSMLPVPQTVEDFWDTSWVNGGALLISKEVLAAIHASTGRYLNPDIFLYGDEMDLCFLARKLGYRIVAAKKAIVQRRKMSASIGGVRSPLAYYYSERNRLLLVRELLPLPFKIIFHPVNILFVVARVSKCMVYGRFMQARAVLWGLFDGYRGVVGRWKEHDDAIRKFRKANAVR